MAGGGLEINRMLGTAAATFSCISNFIMFYIFDSTVNCFLPTAKLLFGPDGWRYFVCIHVLWNTRASYTSWGSAEDCSFNLLTSSIHDGCLSNRHEHRRYLGEYVPSVRADESSVVGSVPTDSSTARQYVCLRASASRHTWNSVG